MPGRGFKHGYAKDPKFYMAFAGSKETPSTFTANDADHERQHRLFQSAFSDRALERQSPIMIKYVDMLVDRRLAIATPRDDIMKFVIEEGNANPKRRLTINEIHSNAAHFWLAGSETTTTTLSSVTYHLLRNPDAYKKLCHEVRSHFSSEEEMTMKSLGHLRYVDACVKEGQRMHTPVPFPLPRRVPPVGATVAGRFVPAGATVAVATHAAHRSPANFTMPDRFLPERWLPDTPEYAQFAGDKIDASQPFGLGPRGRIGKKMAYFQVRLIIAKILFRFDMELLPRCETWDNQKVYGMWEKPPLLVRVTQRRDMMGTKQDMKIEE